MKSGETFMNGKLMKNKDNTVLKLIAIVVICTVLLIYGIEVL